MVDVEPPTTVFDGDCSAMFSDAALSEALGQPLEQPAYPAEWEPALDPTNRLIAQAGGIQCDWAEPQPSADVFTTPVVHVVAVPAATVSVAEDTVCVETDMSGTGCPLDVVANGIRLSGLVTTDLEGADRLARVAAVEALFTASANAAPAGTAPALAPGAWPKQDCAAIAGSLDLSGIPGDPAPLSADTMGSDAYVSAVQVDLQGGNRLYPCGLFSDSTSLTFSSLGGGAWARDDVLALEGSTVVEVAGLDLVVENEVDGSVTIDVFDGVNWLQMHQNGPDRYAYATALVEALNAQA